MEPSSSTTEPKLLTGNPRRDRAAGLFGGFFATLVFVFAADALALWIAPASGSPYDSVVHYENMCQTGLFLTFALIGGIAIVRGFPWLRERVPDVARGYQIGSQIVAIFVWMLVAPSLFLLLFER
jgi:hypothetical protein